MSPVGFSTLRGLPTMPPKNPRAFELRDFSPPPPSPWRWFFPLLLLTVFVIGVSYWFHRRSQTDNAATTNADEPARAAITNSAAPKIFWRRFIHPTARTNLLAAPAVECFQDTGAGVPQSGMFGTVRTGESGLGQFHEGLDIKVVERDRRGRPLDRVFAAADGRVAYVNRIAGNSNYGKYVVLLHADPIGEVYTLYAHLLDVESRVAAGAAVLAGDPIGQVGNTSSSAIPMERAHLHFEIGFVINDQFAAWYRARRQIPDHGSWHGYNLLGLNPLDALHVTHENGRMDMKRLIAATPVAFTAIIRAQQVPDFFKRHPSLWTGGLYTGGAFVITASENGAPLSGRSATADELKVLGRQSAAILSADAAVLGRNGRRLAQPATGGGWKVGTNGGDWLEILLYPQRVR